MPDNAMTIAERRTYLTRMQGRYWAADRSGQGRLLDEMEVMTELHRKSLVRLLKPGGLARQPRTAQRGRVYGCGVDDALRVVVRRADLAPSRCLGLDRLAGGIELCVGEAQEDQAQDRRAVLRCFQPRVCAELVGGIPEASFQLGEISLHAGMGFG